MILSKAPINMQVDEALILSAEYLRKSLVESLVNVQYTQINFQMFFTSRNYLGQHFSCDPTIGVFLLHLVQFVNRLRSLVVLSGLVYSLSFLVM